MQEAVREKSRVVLPVVGFLLAGALVLVCSLHSACTSARTTPPSRKVLMLGIDGMDPILLEKFLQEGKMPNFAKLIAHGDFKPLRTSIPPQSPVAWSNFITGMNPGGHGIFDFIHRDPQTYLPEFSISKAEPPKKTVHIGKWLIPLSSGTVRNLRGGTAFWQILEDHGIPCTIYRIPSNFPPADTPARQISGMGTPDIQGTYGIFSYYTDHPPLLSGDEDFSGGRLVEVWVEDNIVRTELQGPRNDLMEGEDKPYVNVPFTIFIDPVNPVAKIQIQDKEVILNEKGWSDWVRVKFELIPHLKSISGIVRFYLKEVRPDFKLYASPINIDPADPAMPISTPDGYSKELAEKVGLFYTQGIAEDTKALDNGVFDNGDFLTQAGFVLDDSERIFDYELNRFKEGLLFFYFSSLDQGTHMFYRTMDRKHPARIPAEDDPYANALESLYMAMDRNLGKALEHVDADTTLIINSDHGFAPFYKSFHLDSWLEKNGYAVLKGVLPGQKGSLFQHTDWSRTRAYALGLNALYVNLYGREANGIVMPGAERNALLEELKKKLLEVRDPETGEQVISSVYRTDEVYTGPYTEKAPDLIVGYARGYRGSWETALGEFPPDLFSVNKKKWSGDHCMDAKVVPGVIVTNRKIRIDDPALYDIAPTVLREFGIEKEKSMVGRSLF